MTDLGFSGTVEVVSIHDLYVEGAFLQFIEGAEVNHHPAGHRHLLELVDQCLAAGQNGLCGLELLRAQSPLGDVCRRPGNLLLLLENKLLKPLLLNVLDRLAGEDGAAQVGPFSEAAGPGPERSSTFLP